MQKTSVNEASIFAVRETRTEDAGTKSSANCPVQDTLFTGLARFAKCEYRRDSMRTENLKPQDVLVACKIFAQNLLRAECLYVSLAEDLGLSTSTVHESVERCRKSLLLLPSGWNVSAKYLRDLLVVAVPRVFYAVRGGVGRGLPTSVHAPVLAGKFKATGLPVVWREDDAPEGLPEGQGLEPLYPTVPAACRLDNVLYELLALSDVMRIGSASERTLAVDLVDRRLASK